MFFVLLEGSLRTSVGNLACWKMPLQKRINLLCLLLSCSDSSSRSLRIVVIEPGSLLYSDDMNLAADFELLQFYLAGISGVGPKPHLHILGLVLLALYTLGVSLLLCMQIGFFSVGRGFCKP